MLKLLLLIALAALPSIAWGACPGERDDEKRVTVTGTIVYAERNSDGKYDIGLRECHILVEARDNQRGACKVGKKATVTGKFYSCAADWSGTCAPELGDPDFIEASKLTCR